MSGAFDLLTGEDIKLHPHGDGIACPLPPVPSMIKLDTISLADLKHDSEKILTLDRSFPESWEKQALRGGDFFANDHT